MTLQQCFSDVPDDGAANLGSARASLNVSQSIQTFCLGRYSWGERYTELNEMIDILAVCRQEMGMPLEKHLETMDASHHILFLSQETLNLLQQAESKILRFYNTGLGRWVD